MPSLSGQPNISLTVHTTAGDFLSATFEILMQKEEQSNIILSFALNQRRREQAARGPSTTHNLWFTLQPSIGIPAGDVIRPATAQDADQVARLCYEFAEDSVFFPLNAKESIVQAQQLIRDKQLWVYETRDAYNRPCIASMVASSRSSANVAAITKVYTPPAFRGRKYAPRLVQWVTQHLLYRDGKESVVLFVSHENPAEKVYHRVGFAGLCGTPRPGPVEDWLEIGFEDTIRGHW
ncbi:hypothetical protein FRC08_003215 [Ceratobasidium sp. 394]|nr:hypothetical protein FRC08_003215 [Ceratobasidium sp. 394]